MLKCRHCTKLQTVRRKLKCRPRKNENKNRMKLIDLIKYLKSDEDLFKVYHDYNLNDESEAILVYAENTINIDSDLIFFEFEETEDDLKYEKNGRIYFQLFHLKLGVEIYSYFNDVFEKENYSESQKANRILEYVLNDA